MIEIRIHGRGGQGGVTLAKLIATTRYLLGDSVQAFGVYAAERSGAPLQAFCRYDTEPITNRNLIYEPDHVIVLDPTLLPLGVTGGLRAGGWVLINTPDSIDTLRDTFSGYQIAVINATAIARHHQLGTASVPIVNTALLGAACRIYGFELEQAFAALEHLGFVGHNLDAARDAWDAVVSSEAAGAATVVPPSIAKTFTPGLVEGNTGELPRIKTGDWATQDPEQEPIRATPPCNHICPAGNDVQGFLNALAHSDTDSALSILLETTPFPSVCGRVCPAPCMNACNRKQLDGAVNVRDLERWAGDHGNAEVTAGPERTEHLAVIGSGPAGLSAVYHLRRLGYPVTLYDREPELGGLLRTGIPPYRLPREALDRDIDRIIGMGVTVESNHPVDRDELLAITARHDAVLVATGLQHLRELDLGPAEDRSAIMQGIDFLELANRGEVRVDNEDVVVVGGGNTAFDSARSALRLGAASVRIVYRRTRHEMPAIAEEIEEGIEEGVHIDFLTQPIRITPTDDDSWVLTCRPMQLGPPDESGRRRPIALEGQDFTIDCDRLLLALGQAPELAVFPDGIAPPEDQAVVAENGTPVFASGDIADSDGTVTAAIGSGRRIAMIMHRTLTGEDLVPVPADRGVASYKSLTADIIPKRPVDHGTSLAPEERATNYDEVHTGIASAAEALRCMSCGVCNGCDRCVTFCPDGVVTRIGTQITFDFEYCKGCGICAAECPRQLIEMHRL